jgi:hypothetical protein
MKTKIASIFIILIAFSISCKKVERPAPRITNEDLIKGRWLITGSDINPGFFDSTGNYITDLYATYDPCMKDDITVFTKDNKSYVEQGALTCLYPDRDTATVSFNTNKTGFYLHLFGTTNNGYLYEILQLDSHILKFTVPVILESDSTYHQCVNTYRRL